MTFQILVLVAGVVVLATGCSSSASGREREESMTEKRLSSPKDEKQTEVAVFAAGCFWGVQAQFDAVPGVIETRVGYTGGTSKDPTYEDVKTGSTGHAEAVRIVFDPAKVSYEQLLDRFWALHDPTQVDRQGVDVGTQYRSAILVGSPEQRRVAEASKGRHAARLAPERSIATQVVDAGPFYDAEEYHQRYLQKQGSASCPR